MTDLMERHDRFISDIKKIIGNTESTVMSVLAQSNVCVGCSGKVPLTFDADTGEWHHRKGEDDGSVSCEPCKVPRHLLEELKFIRVYGNTICGEDSYLFEFPEENVVVSADDLVLGKAVEVLEGLNGVMAKLGESE